MVACFCRSLPNDPGAWTGAPSLQDEDSEAARVKALPMGVTPELEPIVRVGTELLEMPSALVMLVDSNTGRITAKEGWMHPNPPRKMSFCAWSLIPVTPETLVVEDACQDGRFRQNPLVLKTPFIRFYAGAPLMSRRGDRLGSLCLIDYRTRLFPASACAALCHLANCAEQVLRMDESREVVIVDVTQPGWPVLLSTQRCIGIREVLHGDRRSSFQKAREPQVDLKFATLPACCLLDILELPPKQRADLQRQAELGRLFSFVQGPYALTAMPLGEPPDGRRKIGSLKRCAKVEAGLQRLWVVHAVARDSSDGLAAVTANLLQEPTDSVPVPGLQLTALIGKGSFGKVYDCMYKGKRAAVKVVEVADSETHGSREGRQVLLESMIGTLARHRHLVTTHTFVRVRGAEWIVMEFCDDGTLQHAIDAGRFRQDKSFFHGPPHLARVLATALQICSGMAYLHSQGVVHGDLSANNVLLTSEGIAKVADFGMARQVEDPAVTNSMGTVAYQPPELLRDGLLSAKTDVYSFGVLLFELFTSARAYGGLRPANITYAKLTGAHPLLLPRECPQAFCQLQRDCTAQDAEARPTFEGIAQRIEAMQKEMRAGTLVAGEFAVYA